MFQGIQYYDDMKARLEELRAKHNLGPVEMFKLIQDRAAVSEHLD